MRRAFLIGFALTTLACTRAEIVDLTDGSLDATPGDAGEPDAGAPDAGPGDAGCGYVEVDDVGMPEPDCTLTVPPGRPTCDMGMDGPDLFFAVRSFDFDTAADEGIDLDGFCTTSSSGPANCVPRDGTYSLDRNDSIDNVFGTEFITGFRFSYSTQTGGRQFEDDFGATLESGFRNLTFRVRGWNGLPDDPAVEVAYINTLCGRPAGSTTACPTTPSMTPLDWGLDDNEFVLDEAAFAGGNLDVPVVRAPAAYVSNGVFVAQLNTSAEVALATPTGDIGVRLSQVTILAELSPDGRVMSGTLTGAWDLASILLAPGAFGICPGGPLYPPYEMAVTAALDVTSTGDGGPTVMCDAMSLVVSFSAQIAQPGPLATLPPSPEPCPP